MPEDCNIDFVKVLLWFSDRAVTLKNAEQSVFDNLSLFASRMALG
jgi:hypothetical protein